MERSTGRCAEGEAASDTSLWQQQLRQRRPPRFREDGANPFSHSVSSLSLSPSLALLTLSPSLVPRHPTPVADRVRLPGGSRRRRQRRFRQVLSAPTHPSLSLALQLHPRTQADAASRLGMWTGIQSSVPSISLPRSSQQGSETINVITCFQSQEAQALTQALAGTYTPAHIRGRRC